MATSKVTVHFPCPVKQVWHTVTDLTHTAWRSDLARVEVLDEAHFVEYTKSGYATNFTVTACEPLRFWAFTMENGNMSGSWEGIFEAAEDGTRLTCTCLLYTSTGTSAAIMSCCKKGGICDEKTYWIYRTGFFPCTLAFRYASHRSPDPLRPGTVGRAGGSDERPVSYTHLDVYKRQAVGHPWAMMVCAVNVDVSRIEKQRWPG